MLKSYFDLSYGEFKSQEELKEREEVRYLTPEILKGFIKFYFGEEADWTKLYETLSISLYYNHNLIENDKQHIYYDNRFAFDPFETKINFDYEIKQKYGVKLVPEINKVLPDGRNLVIFKEPKSLIDLEKIIKSSNYEIELKKVFNKLEDNYNMKFTEYNKEFYKQGFIDGVNLILNCLKI